MADADTIHRLAEILFGVATGSDTEHITALSFEVDTATRVKYSTFTVAVSLLPDDLRRKINGSVERNTAAFLASFGIVCKPVDVPGVGRAFHFSLPGELIGCSWSQILESHGLGRPKDDEAKPHQ